MMNRFQKALVFAFFLIFAVMFGVSIWQYKSITEMYKRQKPIHDVTRHPIASLIPNSANNVTFADFCATKREKHSNETNIYDEDVTSLVQKAKEIGHMYFKDLAELYNNINNTAICRNKTDGKCLLDSSIINENVYNISYIEFADKVSYILGCESLVVFTDNKRTDNISFNYTNYHTSLNYLNEVRHLHKDFLGLFKNISSYDRPEEITKYINYLEVYYNNWNIITCAIQIFDRHSLHLPREYTFNDFNETATYDPKCSQVKLLSIDMEENAWLKNSKVLFENSFLIFIAKNASSTNDREIGNALFASKYIKKVDELIKANEILINKHFDPTKHTIPVNMTSIFEAYLKAILNQENEEYDIEYWAKKFVTTLTEYTGNKIAFIYSYDSGTNKTVLNFLQIYLEMKNMVIEVKIYEN